jgi:hypothetical protein
MKIFFLFLFLPNILFSQNAKFKILSEEKAFNNTIIMIVELEVKNDSLDPVCIIISPSFLNKNLNKDTVELATFGNDSYASYDLLFTIEDVGLKSESIRQYPLILYGLTSFVATLKFVRKTKCKDQLFKFSYLKIPRYNYNILLDKFWQDQDWGPDIKFKIQTKSIHF